jgi:hypothetical protein
MFAVPCALAAQEDAAVGTWRLNHAKSSFTSPAPKRETVVIEPAPDGFKFMAKGVDAKDNPTSTTYTATYNGATAPVTIVGPQAGDYDTISVKRLDDRKAEGFLRKNGRVVQTYSRVVNRARDMMTITMTGTNASGGRVVNVAVYDRQPDR